MQAATLPKPHEVGEVFGPYRLERLLGRGAAAEVWLAVEVGAMGFTKRQALKLLRPPIHELESQKKALINEARVCGRLKHPGIVDVYRVGEHDSELFIAMEYVDGTDLNTLLEAFRTRRVEIPVEVALEVASELCEALHHAHTATGDEGEPLQIVHRDLKPSNVLVDRRGVLKVSDWGLVKSALNVESTTRGVVKGTPGYIAPEVWGGTRDFKPAVDLFAVGAIVYELVVGERLFAGRNLARIAEQVARRRPEEEAAKVAPRAPELVPVLERLLQRVPEQRHQSAGDLSALFRLLREQYPNRQGLKGFLRDNEQILEVISPSGTSTGHGVAVAVSKPPTPLEREGVEPPTPIGPAGRTDPPPPEEPVPGSTRAMPAEAGMRAQAVAVRDVPAATSSAGPPVVEGKKRKKKKRRRPEAPLWARALAMGGVLLLVAGLAAVLLRS